jgi:RHS repeat-associated protein
VTDAAGAVREHHESFPFGEPWIEESSASDTTPFRFTGKELDPETGLQYFGARYYDPRQGQWASVDPILSNITSDNRIFVPARMQLYSYAANSPVMLIDPDGRDFTTMSGNWRVNGFFQYNYHSPPSRAGNEAYADISSSVRFSGSWVRAGRGYRLDFQVNIVQPLQIHFTGGVEMEQSLDITGMRTMREHENGHGVVAERFYTPQVLNEVATMAGIGFQPMFTRSAESNTEIGHSYSQAVMDFYTQVDAYVQFYTMHRAEYEIQQRRGGHRPGDYTPPAVPAFRNPGGGSTEISLPRLNALVNRLGSGIRGFVPLPENFDPRRSSNTAPSNTTPSGGTPSRPNEVPVLPNPR